MSMPIGGHNPTDGPLPLNYFYRRDSGKGFTIYMIEEGFNMKHQVSINHFDLQ